MATICDTIASVVSSLHLDGPEVNDLCTVLYDDMCMTCDHVLLFTTCCCVSGYTRYCRFYNSIYDSSRARGCNCCYTNRRRGRRGNRAYAKARLQRNYPTGMSSSSSTSSKKHPMMRRSPKRSTPSLVPNYGTHHAHENNYDQVVQEPPQSTDPYAYAPVRINMRTPSPVMAATPSSPVMATPSSPIKATTYPPACPSSPIRMQPSTTTTTATTASDQRPPSIIDQVDRLVNDTMRVLMDAPNAPVTSGDHDDDLNDDLNDTTRIRSTTTVNQNVSAAVEQLPENNLVIVVATDDEDDEDEDEDENEEATCTGASLSLMSIDDDDHESQLLQTVTLPPPPPRNVDAQNKTLRTFPAQQQADTESDTETDTGSESDSDWQQIVSPPHGGV